jgi:anti-sigma-K factor RskA
VSTRDDSEREAGHVEFDALSAGWALHALEPDDERRFASHLATCATCRLTVAELEATLGELALDAPDADPPADLLDRIQVAMADDAPRIVSVPDRASEERAEEYHSRASIHPSSGVPPVITVALPHTRHATRWLAVAAAAVLVALAGWNVLLQQQLSRQQARNTAAVQVLTRVAVSKDLATLVDGKETPVGLVLLRGSQLDVVSMGLPASQTATSYWLWALPASGAKPLAMGHFEVTATVAAVHTVGEMPTGLAVPAAFAVSVESGTAKPAAPSRVIASGKVTA